MRKIKFLLCLVLVVWVTTACTSPSPADRKFEALSIWRADASAREARGELTKIDKLKELYALLATDPVSSSDAAGMRWASTDIDTLEALHAGKIDRSQAESRLRQSETAWRAESAARDAASKPINTRCITWQGFTQCGTQ
ncbi:hypothetical protein [Achromobacter sp.]|uniref:hypothetical protein n=1 Tax=Achromobacter sp. TaxID=134375 RepID=UPI0028ADCC75|nr:hypothetical protein [Achromobacter sp.]